MDENKLKQLAKAFVRELQTSKDLQDHMAEHRRRSQRAREMLRLEHIPSLTEDDLFVLFSDSDSFSPWFLRDKERGFKARLQKFGIERLRDALRELVARGERGLTSDDLGLIWKMRGLGTLLSTELLAYRFPTRYWTYSPNVTLPAFQKLGEDVKAAMPRGQKSEPYVYLALQPHMDKVSQALRDAGLKDVDYLTADVFLWWVKQEATEKAARADIGKEKLTPSQEPKIWLFQANPRFYNLAEDLADVKVGDEDGWIVSRYRDEMRTGDIVVLWQSGKDAGVYAVGELIGIPAERDWEPEPEELEERPYLRSRVWVPFRYIRILRQPIPRQALLTHPILQNMQVLKQAQGSNFRVTPQEWQALQKLIDEAGSIPPRNPWEVIRSSVAAQGLHFTPWQLATFYTALQTKGFVILSGISGTGKTKLAQAFARLLPQPQEGDNWLFVSVRPDWRDSKSLLGYYNPLTGNYEWTDFLRFLLRAERNYRSESSLAWFVILDEMNLAHVEYYFADLLSVLESGRDEAGWTREPLRLSYPDGAQGDLPPRALRLPPNLYIVGTVNVDETTQAFSPKVLDRAFTLELTEADFSAYPPGAGEGRAEPSDEERQAILEDFGNGGTFVRISKEVIGEYVREHPEVRERLQKLSELLRPHELHFGYRVFDEIVSFLDAAERNGLYEDLGGAEAAFDAAVLMKVLPKFHGSRGKLEAALKKVLAWCLNPDRPAVDDVERTIQGQGRESMDGGAAVEALAELGYTYQQTAGRVLRMLRALYETGFAAFA